MASDNVSTFTDGNFDAEVLGSETPVLVDFWAEWCQPCKMLAPTIDEIADDFAGQAKVGKVDVDNNRAVSAKYGIRSIPTVLIFKNGEPVKQFVGLTKKDELATAISEAQA